MEFRDGVRNAVFDAQVASGPQYLISTQHGEYITRIVESQTVVNVLNLQREIFLKREKSFDESHRSAVDV